MMTTLEYLKGLRDALRTDLANLVKKHGHEWTHARRFGDTKRLALELVPALAEVEERIAQLELQKRQ